MKNTILILAAVLIFSSSVFGQNDKVLPTGLKGTQFHQIDMLSAETMSLFRLMANELNALLANSESLLDVRSNLDNLQLSSLEILLANESSTNAENPLLTTVTYQNLAAPMGFNYFENFFSSNSTDNIRWDSQSSVFNNGLLPNIIIENRPSIMHQSNTVSWFELSYDDWYPNIGVQLSNNNTSQIGNWHYLIAPISIVPEIRDFY